MTLVKLIKKAPETYASLEDWLKKNEIKNEVDIQNPIIRLTFFLKELYKLTKIPCRAGQVHLTEMRNLFRIDPMVIKIMQEQSMFINLTDSKAKAIYKWNTTEPSITNGAGNLERCL